MQTRTTTLDGVVIIEPRVWEDLRGFFFESYNEQAFAAAGITQRFVQDNHSFSRSNTLRGMHFQHSPRAQDKLVRAVAGEIWDVVVDLRKSSSTFKRWEGFTLSATNKRMLLVPKGFAHGFCVLSETAEVIYKCTDFYAPAHNGGVRWDDPDIGISWPVSNPVLSDQDRKLPLFKDLPQLFS